MSQQDPTLTAEPHASAHEVGVRQASAAPWPQGPAAAHAGSGTRNGHAAAGDAQLIALLASRGFARVEPPILQPLEPFLDLSGEELRRRMFVTTDAQGREWCLRPEYTIPVSRHHLERPDAPKSGTYAYLGPVFRFRPGETGEFSQAGVEDYGREDREAADAEILDVALEALNELGAKDVATLIGDVGLFAALLSAMRLQGSTARRLRRGYASGRIDDKALAALGVAPDSENRHAGLLAALQGQAPEAARLFVEDILSIAGISTHGGRSVHQIAARFLEQASEAKAGLSEEQIGMLRRFLSIEGHPDAVADALRAFAADTGLELGAAIEKVDIRNGFMEVRGIDLAAIRMATAFGRSLDYYTGFVFEIVDPKSAVRPLVGGGRYDRLLRRLGAASDIPAVGCSIWLERIAGSAR